VINRHGSFLFYPVKFCRRQTISLGLTNLLINLIFARGSKKKQKRMATVKHDCPHCQKRAKHEAQSEEFNFAVLIALVPLMVFTLFGQIGLF